MKNFLVKSLIFFLPIELIIIAHLTLDPFRIIYDYDDPYEKSIVALNRSEICKRVYLKNREELGYNAFIFGSSRSQGYKCKSWEKHLPNDATALHFDGSGEGIWGIATKVNYIDELGDSLKYALVSVDGDLLINTDNNKKFFTISPPEMSKESYTTYYTKYIQAGLDLKFLAGYIDMTIFGKYRPYMKKVISRVKYFHRGNPLTADVFYGNGTHIKIDSAGYYNALIEKGVFYDRNTVDQNKKYEVTELEIEQLKSIKKVFDRHKTDFVIIISPLYDQLPLNIEQVELLNEIFGSENVYDFSGKTYLTEPIHNYYEDSHFRPHVANIVMDSVYSSR